MRRKLTDATIQTWANLRRAGLTNEQIEQALKPLTQALSESVDPREGEVQLRQTA